MNIKKKEVILIYDFFSEMGGLERELISHAKLLREEGYKVKILTCHIDENIIDSLPLDGIKIESISKLKSKIESLNLIACYLGLNNLKDYDPDLFISYSAQMNFILRNKKNKKVNFMNHYPNFLYLNLKEKLEWAKSTKGFKRNFAVALAVTIGKFLKKIDIKLVRDCDLVFANSEFTKKRLDEIYNINTIRSYPPLGEEFKISKEKLDKKYIFNSGRVIPDKKVEWLIKAVSLTKTKLPLYISGGIEDSYKKELENLAKSNNVEVKFLGRVSTNDLLMYYTNAAVFAYPTPKEDFGLVPAESLSCGTPCIVWGDGGGPTEQIIPGLNGYHAEPYNLKNFAEKIDLVIESNLKTKNKKKIIDSSKKFTLNSIKKDFIGEIKKVI